MSSIAPDVDTIDAECLRAALAPEVLRRLGALECLGAVDSTNAELLRRGAQQPDYAVLIADSQSAGRGRLGRAWASPPGANLYLSIHRRSGRDPRALAGLSLAVGVAVAEALHAQGYGEVRLKWPNDLVVQARKLGGVLIELVQDAAVIGIGLNVRMPGRVDIDQPWIDLAALGAPPARQALAAALLNHVLPALEQFEARGLDAFRERWEALDAFAGRAVRVVSGERELEGLNLGLAVDGGLRLRFPDGDRVFHSADVSLRAP